jgi:hypothetical protein
MKATFPGTVATGGGDLGAVSERTTLTPLAADSKSNPRHEKSVTSITNRKSGLCSLCAELSAALGGGEDSIEEGGAGARPLEGAEAGGGGAPR